MFYYSLNVPVLFLRICVQTKIFHFAKIRRESSVLFYYSYPFFLEAPDSDQSGG